MVAMKLCSTPGCDNPAAYRTRSKPAYCLDCIDRIMDESGLVRLEPFTGPRYWMLTRCKVCGVEAHYRFEYTLHKHEIGEPVCRACYWRQWFRDSWATYGVGQGTSERFRNEYCSKLSPLVAISYSMLYPATGQGRSCTMYVASHAAGLASSDWAILYGVAPAPRPRVSSVRLVGKSWISMRVRGGRDNLWQKSQGNN